MINRKIIAGELRAAAGILENNLNGGRDGSASWRVADAGLQLRKLMEASKAKGEQGFDEVTGMGALLPFDSTDTLLIQMLNDREFVKLVINQLKHRATLGREEATNLFFELFGFLVGWCVGTVGGPEAARIVNELIDFAQSTKEQITH